MKKNIFAATMAVCIICSGASQLHVNALMKKKMISIKPIEISVDLEAKPEDETVKFGWWKRTETQRDIWLQEEDLYEGESAPIAIMNELEEFVPGSEPIGFSKDSLIEITFWDKDENNVTAALFSNSMGSYCLVGDKWYETSDTHVLDRIKAAIDAVSDV